MSVPLDASLLMPVKKSPHPDQLRLAYASSFQHVLCMYSSDKVTGYVHGLVKERQKYDGFLRAH